MLSLLSLVLGVLLVPLMVLAAKTKYRIGIWNLLSLTPKTFWKPGNHRVMKMPPIIFNTGLYGGCTSTPLSTNRRLKTGLVYRRQKIKGWNLLGKSVQFWFLVLIKRCPTLLFTEWMFSALFSGTSCAIYTLFPSHPGAPTHAHLGHMQVSPCARRRGKGNYLSWKSPSWEKDKRNANYSAQPWKRWAACSLLKSFAVSSALVTDRSLSALKIPHPARLLCYLQ